jgi:putative PIN family toxin of toxin-antitoxin system
LRIVLDTNVIFSALLWRGTPYRLLATIGRQPRTQLFTSAVLLEELAEVLTRPSATRRLALIGKSVREVLADYVAAVELVEPIDTPRVVPDDPDDDHVIAAAATAQAELIVSGDADLLSIGRFEGIDIVTAAQAVERIDG